MTVELDSAAAEPIRGFLDDGRGAPIGFAGWLEPMSALDTARERRAPASAPAGEPAADRNKTGRTRLPSKGACGHAGDCGMEPSRQQALAGTRRAGKRPDPNGGGQKQTGGQDDDR